MWAGWIWVMMMVETPRGSKPSSLILATALPGQSMRARVPPARSRTDALSLCGVGTQPPVPKKWISAMTLDREPYLIPIDFKNQIRAYWGSMTKSVVRILGLDGDQ